MSLYTDCSDGVLATLPADDCPESFGQTSRAIIMKRKNGSALNEISISADEHLALGTYQALIAATDDTKAVVTPIFASPTMPEPEVRTALSGNEAPLGVPLNLGEGPSSFTARLIAKKQEIVKAMKQLSGDLAVILIDHTGRILADLDDRDNPTRLRPIPIQNFNVTSKQLGGYDGPDANAMAWSFLPNWSDDTKVFTPSFNPITEI